jgi:transcriptional regulator with XRE-family HTH domain
MQAGCSNISPDQYRNRMATSVHSIGPVIQEHRKMRNWSQEDLARKVGVRALAVGKWERGQATPTHENRLALARAFGADAADFGYEPPPFTTGDAPPEWFTQAIEQQNARLDDIHTTLKQLLARR